MRIRVSEKSIFKFNQAAVRFCGLIRLCSDLKQRFSFKKGSAVFFISGAACPVILGKSKPQEHKVLEALSFVSEKELGEKPNFLILVYHISF